MGPFFGVMGVRTAEAGSSRRRRRGAVGGAARSLPASSWMISRPRKTSSDGGKNACRVGLAVGASADQPATEGGRTAVDPLAGLRSRRIEGGLPAEGSDVGLLPVLALLFNVMAAVASAWGLAGFMPFAHALLRFIRREKLVRWVWDGQASHGLPGS